MNSHEQETSRNPSIDPVGRARVRHLVATGFDASVRWLCVAAGVALAVLVIDRALALALPIALYPLMLLAGPVIGVVRGLAARQSRFEVARRIDRRLDLKDRLATAEVLHETGGQMARYDAAFAAIVLGEAQRLAGALDVRTIAPIRLSRWWMPALALSAAVLAGARFLPASFGTTPGNGGEDEPGGAALVGDVPREQMRETIDRAREELREAASDLPEDETAREAAAILDRLAEQMQDPAAAEVDLRPIRDQSAAELDALADRLAEQARRERLAAEKLAERFAGLDPPEAPMTAAEFEETLRRGDFGAAGDHLAEQLARRDRMTDQERDELARHLRELGAQIEQSRNEADPELDEQAARLEQAMRDQGLDDQTIDELLNRAAEERNEQPADDPSEADPHHDPEDALRKQNVDPEVARRLAREIERLQENREASEQVDRDLENIEQALRDAADEFDPGDNENQQPPADDHAAGDEPSPDQHGAEESAEQPRSRPGEPSRREPGAQPNGTADPTSPEDERAPGAPPAQTGEQVGDQGGEEQGLRPSGAEAEDGPPRDAPAPGAGERDPRRALQELAERRRQADRREDVSRSMRERAREVLDQMTPEERRQLFEHIERQFGESSDAADRTAGDAGPTDMPSAGGAAGSRQPGDIEDIDMRRAGEDPGDVIAEWQSEFESEFDPQTARRTIPREQLESARRVAEHAVNEAAVPSRYHQFIRRYFGRLPEAGDSPSAADDAPPPSGASPPVPPDDTGS